MSPTTVFVTDRERFCHVFPGTVDRHFYLYGIVVGHIELSAVLFRYPVGQLFDDIDLPCVQMPEFYRPIAKGIGKGTVFCEDAAVVLFMALLSVFVPN